MEKGRERGGRGGEREGSGMGGEGRRGGVEWRGGAGYECQYAHVCAHPMMYVLVQNTKNV